MIANENLFTLEKLDESKYTETMYNHRITELEKLGLIKNTNGVITTTKFGNTFCKIMNFTSDVLNKKK